MIKLRVFFSAVKNNSLDVYFGAQYFAGIMYARKLTFTPGGIREEDIDHLRICGFSDGEILEINQVTSYFNYANRTVLGLGVTTEGDILGLSPNDSDDPQNWSHR